MRPCISNQDFCERESSANVRNVHEPCRSSLVASSDLSGIGERTRKDMWLMGFALSARSSKTTVNTNKRSNTHKNHITNNPCMYDSMFVGSTIITISLYQPWWVSFRLSNSFLRTCKTFCVIAGQRICVTTSEPENFAARHISNR